MDNGRNIIRLIKKIQTAFLGNLVMKVAIISKKEKITRLIHFLNTWATLLPTWTIKESIHILNAPLYEINMAPHTLDNLFNTFISKFTLKKSDSYFFLYFFLHLSSINIANINLTITHVYILKPIKQDSLNPK